MPILIDGYNVLYQSGLLGKGRGPGFLERARHAFVRFIAASLGPDRAQEATVVFDSKQAPPGAVPQQMERGVTVLYAQGYEDADELLEELIRRAPQPRRLLVISSDHRVQQAARRRRAPYLDAEQWLDELERSRAAQARGPAAAEAPEPEKPFEPLSDVELSYWRDVFRGTIDLPPDHSSSSSSSPAGDSKDGVSLSDLDNPFPPGYLDDLS